MCYFCRARLWQSYHLDTNGRAHRQPRCQPHCQPRHVRPDHCPNDHGPDLRSADVVFLLDASTSVDSVSGDGTFVDKLLPFVAEVQLRTDVGCGASQSRHSAVTFSTRTNLVYNLDNSTANADYAALRRATKAVPYAGGMTLLSDGLNVVINDIQAVANSRTPRSPSWLL